jgi:hypothetical protein
MNIWIGLILGTAAIGVYTLTRLGRASNDIVTEVKGRVHSLDFSQITFSVDALIKNPSSSGITIQYPFVKIFFKESLIASSSIVNQTIQIDPFSETNIKGIKIPASYFNLTGIGAELVQKLQAKKEPIKVQVHITTLIKAAGTNIPFTSKQEMSF